MSRCFETPLKTTLCKSTFSKSQYGVIQLNSGPSHCSNVFNKLFSGAIGNGRETLAAAAALPTTRKPEVISPNLIEELRKR